MFAGNIAGQEVARESVIDKQPTNWLLTSSTLGPSNPLTPVQSAPAGSAGRHLDSLPPANKLKGYAGAGMVPLLPVFEHVELFDKHSTGEPSDVAVTVTG